MARLTNRKTRSKPRVAGPMRQMRAAFRVTRSNGQRRRSSPRRRPSAPAPLATEGRGRPQTR